MLGILNLLLHMYVHLQLLISRQRIFIGISPSLFKLYLNFICNENKRTLIAKLIKINHESHVETRKTDLSMHVLVGP